MNIVFVVYHDLKIEARSQETLETLKLIGDVSLVTYAEPFEDKEVKVHLSKYSPFLPGIRYFLFLLKAIQVIAKEKPDMVVLHDCSPIIPYIKRNHKNTIMVYDQSELIIDRKALTLKSKMLKLFDALDKKYMKLADITISANQERAQLTKEHYDLSEMPIVFDNMHRIDDEFNEEMCDEKYGHYFKEGCFHIVYAGGVQKRRMTYELIEAVGKLGPKYRLIIAGAAPEGLDRFNSILKNENYNNIWYVGFIPRNEWRFLLTKANASFVAFDMEVLNNIYCASGKMYESLFEDVPILASENPPLKRLCNDEKVGVSNNDFYEGLLELSSNYEYYKENAARFRKTAKYEERLEKLAKDITDRLKNLNIG
jgi:hypothetical protein